MARLLDRYRTQIVPELMKKFSVTNPMAVPHLAKIVINMGVGKAIENHARLDAAVGELALITGQKPVVTKATKSVSGFKLREGMPIGCKVTLRGPRMYEFLDRLIHVAIPRIKDFRGLNPDSFDKAGNYTMGLSEQTVFPEVPVDKVEFVQGMDITMVLKSPASRERAVESF